MTATGVGSGGVAAQAYLRTQPRHRAHVLACRSFPVLALLILASFLRLWQLDRVGFNSDEAVYSGTAAAMAGNDTLRTMFPIFRAHPLLLQMLLSVWMKGPSDDFAARAVCAMIGVLTVLATYCLGKRLYGTRAGAVAGLLLALMPYHVTVSRQVLLDGLMTFFATLVVYCVVRYAESGALAWMLAGGAVMGLTVLSKETSIVLLGALYAFFALTPSVRLRLRHIGLGLSTMAFIVAAFPITLSMSGRASAGQHYLLWQLFRRGNHERLFYFHTVPGDIGYGVLAAALIGLMWLRRENTWRERLLLAWIIVPTAFFTLWPVKGYQYLLPIAPVLAILAGRTVAGLATIPLLPQRRWVRRTMTSSVVVLLLISLLSVTLSRIAPSTRGSFLAGTGGIPGGREAGRWLNGHVPSNAELLAIGPSMANVLQFYGNRRVAALSISPDPANRNPAYVPVLNPDLAVRQGRFQYLVWDSYTAARTPTFAAKIRSLVDRYHGTAVFTATAELHTRSAGNATAPVIVIYQVRPL